MTASAPRWDLSNVYPSLDSRPYKNAVKKYKSTLDELEGKLAAMVPELLELNGVASGDDGEVPVDLVARLHRGHRRAAA